MPHVGLALTLAVLAGLPSAAPPPARPLWVAVVAPDLADAFEPLAKARRNCRAVEARESSSCWTYDVASLTRRLRTMARTGQMALAAMDKLRKPKATSAMASSGRPAISPQRDSSILD